MNKPTSTIFLLIVTLLSGSNYLKSACEETELPISDLGQAVVHFGEADDAVELDTINTVYQEEVATLVNERGTQLTCQNVTFSPDGQVIAAQDTNAYCLLFKNGDYISHLCNEDGSYLLCEEITFSPNGQLIAVRSTDSNCHLFSCEGEHILTFTDEDEGESNNLVYQQISFSPDGQFLLALDSENIGHLLRISYLYAETADLDGSDEGDGTGDEPSRWRRGWRTAIDWCKTGTGRIVCAVAGGIAIFFIARFLSDLVNQEVNDKLDAGCAQQVFDKLQPFLTDLPLKVTTKVSETILPSIIDYGEKTGNSLTDLAEMFRNGTIKLELDIQSNGASITNVLSEVINTQTSLSAHRIEMAIKHP